MVEKKGHLKTWAASGQFLSFSPGDPILLLIHVRMSTSEVGNYIQFETKLLLGHCFQE